MRDNNYQNLLSACYCGELKKVKEYLKLGNYINGITENGQKLQTPLYQSLIGRNKTIAKYLLESRADPNGTFNGYNPDYILYTNLSYLILSEADDESGRNAADDPIEYYNIDIPEDINLSEQTEEEKWEWIDKINERFYEVIEENSLIEFLIQNGADVNKPDNDGYTPLDRCFQGGAPHSSKILNKYNAKHSQRYINNGNTNHSKFDDFIKTEFIEKKLPSSHRAIEQSFGWGLRDEGKYKIGFLKTDLNVGDTNELDWELKTPLEFAREIGHKEAENFLVINGGVTSNEMLDLHKEIRIRVREDDIGITKEPEIGELSNIIKNNNLNLVDLQGLTALDLSVKLKHKKARQLLLNQGGKL